MIEDKDEKIVKVYKARGAAAVVVEHSSITLRPRLSETNKATGERGLHEDHRFNHCVERVSWCCSSCILGVEWCVERTLHLPLSPTHATTFRLFQERSTICIPRQHHPCRHHGTQEEEERPSQARRSCPR